MEAENRNEEAIFNKAIEIDSLVERAAFVKSACGDDTELLARVEGLLKAHYEGESFLKSPPADIDVTLDTSPLTEAPGTEIGRYKLLQLIGEGGFGVVYMAEQERPIRRRVALKIIKLGMDTKQVIGRFEAERQALAMMDHPNIARVLDAGATETGRPYFVMELVKGISITEYCDKNNLNTQQRLELFINVCKAVQHAHHKGIIHRDIKPSNVMITLHDGKPVPKIIDFGIAKATQHRLTEKTLFTEFKQFVGTPEYMSPEQAEMSGLDVDTRTDIYSLGVLLYELLTGTTPFDAEKLHSAAYDEIRKIIREDEPPKPSTRLSTLGDALTDVAKHRHTQPGELRRIIRGELDWVVMKALEKDRTRRYETANEFALDIERHLRDEPVVAGPPGAVYQVKKFIRRNRTKVTAVAVVLAAIVVGFVVSTTMYFKAEQAHEKEAIARAEAVAARDEAREAEGVAQQQRKHAQRMLARSQIEHGVRLLNEGKCLGLLVLLEARKTADEIPEVRDQASRLWAIANDLRSGRLVQVVRGEGNSDLAFSPDGRLLAVVPTDTTVQLWDTATWQRHGPPLQLEKIIGAVVFSPDGKLLATHSVEGVSQLWDTAKGEPVGPALRHNGGRGKSTEDYELSRAWWSAAFSPDGKLLATACLDGTVRLWETNTCRPYGEPLRHEDEVWTVAFSPDGKLLASGANDNTTQLWEVSSGQLHVTPLQRDAWLERQRDAGKVIFSPDGKLLATMGQWQKSVDLLWTDSGQLHKRLRHLTLADVTFSPDGKLLATAASDWTARLWDTKTGEPHGGRLRHEANVIAVEFCPDGKLLATSSADKTVRLWEVSSGRPYRQPLRYQGETHRVVFSPDGKLLASSGYDGTTRIWRTYQPLDTKVILKQSDSKLGAISPDGKVGAIISGEMVHLWNTTTITGKTVHLWDTRTFKTLGEPLQHNDSVYVTTFSPDGKLLATGMLGTVQLWNVTNGQPFGEPLSAREGMEIMMLAFSPDGKLLAAAAANWEIRVFEVATGRLLHTFNSNGHVSGAAFSPDGKVLASGSENGVVQQWDLTTGQELASPLKHTEKVRAVEFSPDGKLLATASGEKGRTVRLWDVSIGPSYHSLAMPDQAIAVDTAWNNKGALEQFSTDGTILVRMLPEGKARVWRLPEAPTNLREMQLRTWVALGTKLNDRGEAISIEYEQWQELREELHPQFGKAERSDDYDVPLESEYDPKEQKLFRLETLNIACRVLSGSKQPEDSHFWRERGDIYADMKQWDKAVADYSRAIEVCKKFQADSPDAPKYQRRLADTYRMLGNVFKEMGRLEEAEEAYKKAEEMENEVVDEEEEQRI